LVWDLLCGKLDPHHPLWEWLTRCAAATEADLMWFQENRCVPDILGANHYVTSLRFLDEKLQNYPLRFHGGNGRHHYVDIEAARSLLQCPDDSGSLLMEAWQRYRLPLAITECHIDSTRDDQMRWIVQMWRAANAAKNAGADIRAFTVWALFGAYDWNSLVTRSQGYYEPGAFDVRGPRPRPTAVAGLVKELATGKAPSHPLLIEPGWWLRAQRFFCSPIDFPCAPALMSQSASAAVLPSPRPLLITGAAGTLGSAFARLCKERGLHFCLLSRAEMDIADRDAVERALAQYQPWAVINAAGYVRIDDAEEDVERCFRENTWGPLHLAVACRRHNLALLTFSSDQVFNGQQNAPYIESDQVAPLNTYGKSKAEAEKGVLELYPGALVIRTSAFFGPWDDYNYISMALRALRQGSQFFAADDTVISPTYVPDLVHAALDLLIDKANGIWHLSNGDAVTWAELALRAARTCGLDEQLVQICRSSDLNFVAPRPIYSALGSHRARLMPTLTDALNRLLSSPESQC
ncbi:MAG: SDR family oxidoreductase, partial [Candidatus Binatia bacterium]